MIEAAAAPATRDAILDAVDVLLARYRYGMMTMDDVASEAGAGKGTIYLHLLGKEEILPGNVGHLDLRFFLPAALGGETAIAAMNLPGNADAVIVDLRLNGGGDPTQIALLTN
jgi:C-terminal processing protease CtpA/Prc